MPREEKKQQEISKVAFEHYGFLNIKLSELEEEFTLAPEPYAPARPAGRCKGVDEGVLAAG